MCVTGLSNAFQKKLHYSKLYNRHLDFDLGKAKHLLKSVIQKCKNRLFSSTFCIVKCRNDLKSYVPFFYMEMLDNLTNC